MSSYTNSPACKMLATQCACCGADLVDAKSVELGIGPDCRKRHGYDQDVPEHLRQAANKLVYEIACRQKGLEVFEMVTELTSIGFVKLADRIAHRLAKVVITVLPDGMLALKAPYNVGAVAETRKIPGRRWDSETKTNKFPADQKPAVWGLMKRCYAGLIGFGPKGLFEIH